MLDEQISTQIQTTQLSLTSLHKEWSDSATKLTSQNEDVYRFYKQSVDDLGALRLSAKHGSEERMVTSRWRSLVCNYIW